MNRVKHPHIVPEFYLHYFANGQGKIYVFDKPNFSSFESKPLKIAKINGFYDIEGIEDSRQKQIIEHKLGQIEDRTAPIYNELIEKLESNKFSGFTELERSVLSKFIQVQMARTEGSRNLLKQANMELQKQMKKKITVEAFNSWSSDFIEIDPKSIQLSIIDSIVDITNHELLDRIWTIHKNKTRHKFLTSDHPVCTHNHGNIFKNEHEIFLPLSPSYLLSILIPEQLPNFRAWNNKVIDLNEKEASKWFNEVIILKGERQIYSSENHFTFVERVLNENPLYKTKNQPRIGGPDYH